MHKMHKIGPWHGPKHYFWQPILLEKYQKGGIPKVHLLLENINHNFT